MKILVEGEKYNIEDLNNVFDIPRFYFQNGNEGIINHVGYYHSFDKNELVYLLPKVFMQDGKVFGEFSPKELFQEQISESFKHDAKYNWVRALLVYFYNSLAEFRRRFPFNSITDPSQTFELNSNLGNKEYTYLDLVLSFVNFHKKNKTTILFHHIESISNQAKKPKWNKTIKKSTPIFNSSGSPIYTEFTNKKKKIQEEEELITYFYSILNHFNEEHQLNLSIDKSYNLLKGNAFNKLQKSGLSKLRRIKYRYFADSLKRMFQLCELYLSQTDLSSLKRKKEDFISIKNYNIVFEDMVDKLFSDNLDQSKKVNDISLEDLKFNKDGKIIDHIYEYQSLIDRSNIFYIGDSKYYKPDTQAGKISTYKQFTYAKNVIQFNIDLFNNSSKYYTENIRYRDEITEGYNLTPNFFIYGYIKDFSNFEFDRDYLEVAGEPKKSFHFEDRLFDRDTLFVHQYKINFLYVLKSYSSSNISHLKEFRENTKKKFRDSFIDFFNDNSKCEFEIFEKEFEENNIREFVKEHFHILNGKMFSIVANNLIIAKHNTDSLIDKLLADFHKKELTKE